MGDEGKIDAVDKISGVIKTAIAGWPIYAVIISGGWFFGNLWLDDYISKAIAKKTLELPAVVTVTGDVADIKGDVTEIKGELTTVKADTTAILLHLAGE